MGWLGHILGLDNGSGAWYLWWSGFGANFGELSIVVGLYALLRKHNCATHRCWRLGRHQWVDSSTGLSHALCRKHHPGDHLTAEHIVAQGESDAAHR